MADPHAPAIEISHLQFDKVVFVPVVQGVQFHAVGGFMSSTSLSRRKGWSPWSFKLKTTEIPPSAVHVVVDVPVVLLHRFHRCRMVQTMQYTVEALQFESGYVFFGPCTQVHGQGFPRHQGGEGVAGTPGACSQVFCHPIRCIVGMTLDRHGVL